MLARGRSSRNLNRAREREAWRAPRFHCFIRCWEWTNINFAFESVISTFRCLFICHILEAFPGEKGFRSSRSLLFVIKSILLSRTRGVERWTAGAWSGWDGSLEMNSRCKSVQKCSYQALDITLGSPRKDVLEDFRGRETRIGCLKMNLEERFLRVQWGSDKGEQEVSQRIQKIWIGDH